MWEQKFLERDAEKITEWRRESEAQSKERKTLQARTDDQAQEMERLQTLVEKQEGERRLLKKQTEFWKTDYAELEVTLSYTSHVYC